MKKLITIACTALAAAFAVWAVPSPNTGAVAFNVVYDFAGNPDWSHFNVYYGTSSSNYTASATMSATNFTLGGFNRNQVYFFNMTAVSTNGVESDYTTEQSLRINNKPKPVTSWTMQQ